MALNVRMPRNQLGVLQICSCAARVCTIEPGGSSDDWFDY